MQFTIYLYHFQRFFSRVCKDTQTKSVNTRNDMLFLLNNAHISCINSDIFPYLQSSEIIGIMTVFSRIQLITRISRVSPSGGPISNLLEDLGQVFACDSHDKSYDFLNSN